MDEIAASLLGLIRSGAATSQAQLVRSTGLARATVARRLDALQSSGLVRADAYVRGTGGRPADRLVIDGARKFLLGADVGGSHTRVAIADLLGTLIEVTDHDIDVNDGPDAVLGTVQAAFLELLERQSATPARVAGIAVGIPGPIEQSTGRVVSPPTMRGWDGIDVPAAFTERFDAPIVVDKDANIIAIGEYAHVPPAVRDVLLLKVGMGIGAGIIANGEILRGGQGAAGDLGHLPRPGGERCRCGQFGCAEATAGGWAIARVLERDGGMAVATSADIDALARDGHPLVLDLLRRAGHRLGDVLADAVGMLNPTLVIVGGNLAPASPALLDAIRERVAERSHPLATKNLRIELGALGAEAGLTGAVKLAGDAAFAWPHTAALLHNV